MTTRKTKSFTMPNNNNNNIALSSTLNTNNLKSNPYKVPPRLSKTLLLHPPSSNLSPRAKKLQEFDLSSQSPSNNNKKIVDNDIDYLDEIKKYEQENITEKYHEYVQEVKTIIAAWKIKDFINIIRRKDLKKENKILSTKILTTQEHNVELQEQLDYLEKENKISIARIATYQENDAIMRKAEAELKATVEQERQKRSYVLANIDKDKELDRQKVAEFEEKYIQMERQKMKAEQNFELIKTELDVNQNQLKEVLAQLGIVQMELFASKAEIAKLISIDSLLHDANKDINDKQITIEQQRIQLQEYNDEIEKLKLTYGVQQQQYDVFVEAANKERAEKMSLQNVVSDLAFQLKDSQIKISELEGIVSVNNQKNHELNLKIIEKDKKMEDYQDKLKLAIRHIENLKVKNDDSRRQKECFNMLVEDMEEHMRYDSEMISNTSKYCQFLEEQVLNLRRKIPVTLDNNNTNVFKSRYDKPEQINTNTNISKTKSNNKMEVKRNESIGNSSIPSENSISVNSKNISRDIVSITDLLNKTSSKLEPNETEEQQYLEVVDDDVFEFNDSNYDNGFIQINPMYDSLTPQVETEQMFERMEQLEGRLASMLQTFEEKLISSQSSAPLITDVFSTNVPMEDFKGRRQIDYLEKTLTVMDRRIKTYIDDLIWLKGEIERKKKDIKALDKKIYLDFNDEKNKWIDVFSEKNQRKPNDDDLKDFVFTSVSTYVSTLQKLMGDLISTITKAKLKKNSISILDMKINKVNGALLFFSSNTNENENNIYWENLGIGPLEEILEEKPDADDDNNNQLVWLTDINANNFDLSSLISSQQEYIDKGLREINITPFENTLNYMKSFFGKEIEKPEILTYNQEIDEKKKMLQDICNKVFEKKKALDELVNKRESKLQELEKWENDFSILCGREPDDDEKMNSRPYQLLCLSMTDIENILADNDLYIKNYYKQLNTVVDEANIILDKLYELTYEKTETIKVKYYMDLIETLYEEAMKVNIDNK